MRTIYRNSPRMPELRQTYTAARRFDQKAGAMVPCTPEEVWAQLDENPEAMLTEAGGVLTLYPSRWRGKDWWELRRPDDPEPRTFADWLATLPATTRAQLKAELDRLAHEPWGDE